MIAKSCNLNCPYYACHLGSRPNLQVHRHGSLNVPIEHHPTIRYMVYNGYYKVMSNIPKMGQLPTPDRYPISSNIDYSTLNISYFPIIIPLVLDFMPSNLPFYRLNKSIIEVYKLETGNYQKPPAKAHVFYCGNLQPFGNYFTSLQDALLQPFLDHWHQRQQRCSGDLRDPTAHLRCGAAARGSWR